MLTVIYKLIATLLSTRLSSINKEIISPQQTGFIQGRSILENISLAWMTFEWVTKNQIPTLRFLLDSEKAFDRVEHAFIWAVLEKLGLGGTFLTLVHGLLSRVFSKVHVNGYFTKEIPLTRGVRQGFRLSPLLYALTTQPFMDYVSHKLETGELEGIKVTNATTICIRFFADDLGIFLPANERNFMKM